MLLGPSRADRPDGRQPLPEHSYRPREHAHKITHMEPTTSENRDSSATQGSDAVTCEYIVSTPETCGGKPRIAGSRIQVKHIVVMHERQGMTPEQIISEYSHLTLPGIVAALAYYHDHREDVDSDIRAERESYDEMKSKHLSRLQEKLKTRNSNVPDESFSPR